MHRYIGKRFLMLIPVIFGVILILFTMLEFVPGDPARIILGEQAPPEAIAQTRTEMGLDDPYIVRLFRYTWNLITLNPGTSYATRRPVLTEIGARFPTTMALAGMGMLIATLVGIPLGIISATKQYKPIDYIVQVVGLVGVSIPNFWLALMLIILFSVNLGWLPATGWRGGPQFWILPAITMSSTTISVLMRFTRSSMLEVIRQDYIRTARAKGQKESTVIVRHALKNALIPVITIIGLNFGGAMAGAVLTESVFAIPGLGSYNIDAITRRDHPVILTSTILLAISFSVANLLVDITYAFVDPRIRSQYK